jgi:type II secretion system protein N
VSAASRTLAKLGDMASRVDVPPRMQRVLRLFGYPVFGLIVALITFTSALPNDKIRDRLETMLSADPSPTQPLGLGIDVKAGDLSLSLLRRGIVAENVVLRTRPRLSTEKPTRYVIDRVKVNVGLLGALFQRPTYDFSAEAFSGTVDGSVRVAASGARYRVNVDGVDLGVVQGLQTALGVPLAGKVGGKLDLDAPGRLLSTANGTLEVSIDEASLGDGKAKLVIPRDPFLSQGVTLPRLKLGKVTASLNIEKGKGQIETLRAHSADVDITLEGYVELRDPIASSQLHLFLRFKISDAALKREPTLELLASNLGTLGKRSDGFIGAQLTGTIGAPSFQAAKTPPPGVTSREEGGGVAPTPAAPAAPGTPATVTVAPPTTPAAATPPVVTTPPAVAVAAAGAAPSPAPASDAAPAAEAAPAPTTPPPTPAPTTPAPTTPAPTTPAPAAPTAPATE